MKTSGDLWRFETGRLGIVRWLTPLLLLVGCSSPSATPDACGKDSDCKGARLCVKGACVDPPSTATPAATNAGTGAGTATQAPKPTATATAAPAGDAPRLLAADEQADVAKVLSRFNIDFKQTFRLTLNGFGECVFASTTFKDNNDGDFIIVAEGKTYPLPKLEDTKPWTRTKVLGVWFGKLDADDQTDVIAIAEHMTGVGPDGAKPFPVVFYYNGAGPKAFRLDVEKSRKATEKKIASLAEARDFAKGGAPEKECTGDNANSEIPCTLKDKRIGWCSGGKCKDVCPAGFSYSPTDTRCHQTRDCKATSGDTTPAKTAKCDNCMGGWCMDESASRDMK